MLWPDDLAGEGIAPPALPEGPFDEQVQKAFQKILRCASVKEQSSLKMAAKLAQAGFSPAVIKTAMDKAVRCSCIDDARYAECLIRSTLAKGNGLSFALEEIGSLGIDPDQLESYQDYLDAGSGYALEQALRCLEGSRVYGKDPYARCVRKLISKGHSPETASEAARLHVEREGCRSSSSSCG